MKLIFHMRSGMAVNIDIPEIQSMMQLDAALRIDGCVRIGTDMWINRDGIDWIQNGDTVHLDKHPDGSMSGSNRLLQ